MWGRNHEAQNDKLCNWSGRGKCLSLIETGLKDKQAVVCVSALPSYGRQRAQVRSNSRHALHVTVQRFTLKVLLKWFIPYSCHKNWVIQCASINSRCDLLPTFLATTGRFIVHSSRVNSVIHSQLCFLPSLFKKKCRGLGGVTYPNPCLRITHG